MKLSTKIILLFGTVAVVPMLFFALEVARLVASDQEAYLGEFQSRLALLARGALMRRMDALYAELRPAVASGKTSSFAPFLPFVTGVSVWEGERNIASLGHSSDPPPAAGVSHWALLPAPETR